MDFLGDSSIGVDFGPIIELKTMSLLYLKGKGSRSFLKMQESERLRLLRGVSPWSELRPDVQVKLARLPEKQLHRLAQTWLGIEDSLLTSTPEALVFPDSRFLIYKMWKWTMSLGAHHGGPTHVIRLWKEWTNWIKRLSLKSSWQHPPPTECPFRRPDGTFSTKYLSGAWLWLADVVQNGIRFKTSGTRLSHLISTRGLPAPQKSDFLKEVNLHGSIICKPTPLPTAPERRLLSGIGRRIGKMCRGLAPRDLKSQAHISVSNSACVENPRRQGGRGAYIGYSFALWSREIVDTTVTGVTWFGKPYRLLAGRPRYSTMCRETILEREFLESDCFEGDELDIFDAKYTNPLAGLDSTTGYQILQWAIEEGIRTGNLSGSPYQDEKRPLVVNPLPRGCPMVKVSPIGEPGLKTRVITAGEAWLTILLSPLGHELNSWLSSHPSCRTGLVGGAPASEFVKRLMRVERQDGCQFLTSDLTQATENLDRGVLRLLLKSFCTAFLGRKLDPFRDLLIELLLAPRHLSKCDLRGYEFLGRTTERGIPMGDPGARGALMLFVLACEEIAYRRYVHRTLDTKVLLSTTRVYPWRTFDVAGDDHEAYGPPEYLSGISDALREFGGEVHPRKTYVSNIGGFYGEELILNTPRVQWGAKGNLWTLPYWSTLHVDSVKIRLLSPAERVTLVRDESNPAIGKSLYINKKVLWLPDNLQDRNGLQRFIYLRFRQRFRRFVDWDNPMTYVPERFGGLGLPYLEPSDVNGIQFQNKILELDPLVLRAIELAEDPKCPFVVRAALWTFRANTSFRGMSVNDLLRAQIKTAFTMDPTVSLTDEQLRERLGKTEEQWSMLRYRDKVHAAKSIGYLSTSEVVEVVQRPTYFKSILANEGFHLKEEPYGQALRDLDDQISRELVRYNLTYSDWGEIFPTSLKSRKALETKANAISWQIQTDSKRRLPLIQAEVAGSYNTKPWPVRTKNMMSSLRWVWDASWGKTPQDISGLLKVLETRTDIRYEDQVFVHSSRLSGMCSLETPFPMGPPNPDNPVSVFYPTK